MSIEDNSPPAISAVHRHFGQLTRKCGSLKWRRNSPQRGLFQVHFFFPCPLHFPQYLYVGLYLYPFHLSFSSSLQFEIGFHSLILLSDYSSLCLKNSCKYFARTALASRAGRLAAPREGLAPPMPNVYNKGKGSAPPAS